MKEYVYHDGKFIAKEKALIPVTTNAFLYGTSVFEGIRAYWNEEENQLYAFRVKEHYERLVNSAKIMFMTPTMSIDEYCKLTAEQLRKNNYRENTYIRPTLYKCAQKVGPGLYDNPDAFVLLTNKMGDYIDTSKGLRVCVSSWRRNGDNSIPPRAKVGGSYANAALIKTDAHNMGFDDAVVLDEAGQVTEGSAMNLFLVENGKLITSQKTDNILIGITRNTIIELAKDLGIEVEERAIDRSELYIADEAFYCGTGAQVSPIVEIDGRKLGEGKVGPIATKLQDLYFNVVKGKVAKYKHWCMPVY